MVAYRRLGELERVRLEALWKAGLSMSQIARQLDRSRSTITRELARNSVYRWKGAINPRSDTMGLGARGRYQHGYNRATAQRLAQTRARTRPRAAPKLAVAGPLRHAVVAGLTQRWSPRQISRRLAAEHPGQPQWQVSHETIYQAIYVQSRGNLRAELADQVALRSGRTRRRSTLAAGPLRSGRPWAQGHHISTRPPEATDRAVPGHWEGDLIIGAGSKSAIITLVERSTRYVMLGALPAGWASQGVTDVLCQLMGRLPTELGRSLTWDNGTEMAQHAHFTIATGCPVFFADPHSPWQRGSNENTNGLLRQYFPKHTFDFRTVNQHDLDAVARELNGRPRMTLAWKKPTEALNEYLVALAA